MATIRVFAILFAAVFLIGCVPSLHPLYTESDVVFDEELIGDWHEEDEDEIWTFERGEDGGYYLIITETDDDADGDDELEFRAVLFELNGRRFIDFHAEPPGLSGTSYEDLMLPMRFFGTIDIADDHFDIALMEGDSLAALAESGVEAPSHVDMGGYLLLTAPTEEMQAFVKDHMNAGLFSVTGRMTRK